MERFFETTEIWFHPKRESHGGTGEGQTWRGAIDRGSGKVDTRVPFPLLGGVGEPDTWVLMPFFFFLVVGGDWESRSLAFSILGRPWFCGGWDLTGGGDVRG